MLLLVTNPKIHEYYNYVPPKRQPSYQAPTHAESTPRLPDLNQPAWSVVDCDIIVQHLKKLLMAVLQGILSLIFKKFL